MYIKKIIIKGFKSYKEELVLGELDPGCNCIVGRNGSGKSNLFKAIEFVLTDEYSNLVNQQRHQLLFDQGKGDMTAFVEIVFDTTSRKFPMIEKDEVSIRRSIGLKKDELFLDRQHVRRADIANLLESAGFSKSNPYYIVQQGKINHLTTMKDADRLELLKEVAGTHVYDERRKESIKILEESKEKMEQILQVLDFIRARLGELESEKAELKEYQELDKQRRVLDYSLHSRQLSELTMRMDELESHREKIKQTQLSHQEGLDKIEDDRSILDSRLKESSQFLLSMREKMEMEKKQRDSLLQERARLRQLAEETAADKRSREEKSAALKKKIDSLSKEIEKKQKLLNALLPDIEKKKGEERELRASLGDAESRLESLQVKRGRQSQFGTEKQRNSWIDAQMTDLDKKIAADKAQTQEVKKAHSAHLASAASTSAAIDKLEQERSEISDQLTESTAAAKKLHAELTRKRNAQHESRRELSEQQQAMKETQKTFEDAKNAFYRMMPPATNAAVQLISRYVKERNIRGYYGLVIDLFTCEEVYHKAVESAAGSSLFFAVVSTDELAAELLNHLRTQGQGVLSFIPLNKIMPKENPDISRDDLGSEASFLVDHLTCEAKVRAAIQQVFGRVLICLTAEAAVRFRKNFNIQCVSFDGEKVVKKGAITGGYMDKSSRIRSYSAMKAAEKKITESEAKLADSLAKTNAAEQELGKTNMDIARLEGELKILQSKRANIASELTILTTTRAAAESAARNMEDELRRLESQIASAQARRDRFAAEKASAFKATLSETEENELTSLTARVTELRQKLNENISKAAASRESESQLRNEIGEDLTRRLTQAQQQLAELESDAGVDFSQETGELKSLNDRIAALEASTAAMEKQLIESEKQHSSLKKDVEANKQAEAKLRAKIDEHKRKNDSFLSEKMGLLDEIAAVKDKLSQVGTMPEGASKNDKTTSAELRNKLSSVNEKLKKFAHVNKKALDQYSSYAIQKQQLEERFEASKTDSAAIEELIASLDAKKDESTQLTFRMVAKQFESVFPQIVQGGTGKLILKHSEGDKKEFTGVGFTVCFDGKTTVRSMDLLSGGQRSVVALALIFAIQRNDPAPFYIFDEVDANLDPIYRTRVAEIIRRLSSERPTAAASSSRGDDSSAPSAPQQRAQFITSTFQPELVECADSLWFVSMHNKISRIESIEKKQALEVLADARTGGAAGATDAATAGERSARRQRVA